LNKKLLDEADEHMVQQHNWKWPSLGNYQRLKCISLD